MGAPPPPPPPLEETAPAGPTTDGRRRGLLAAAIIAAAGTVAIGLVLATRSSDERAVDWSAIASVDRRTGAVTIYDDRGEALSELGPGVGTVDYVIGEGRHLAVVGRGRAAIHDVVDGTVEAPELADDARAARVPTSRALVLAAAPPTGGEAMIVTPDAALDVARLAQLDEPLVFIEGVRSDPDGTVFAVPEARSLQTVLVRPDRDRAVVLPGLPVGVSDDLAATLQPSGPRSELRFSTPDGELLRSIDVPTPVVAVLTPDRQVVLVTAEGELLQAGRGDEEAESVATLELPGDVVTGAIALDGQRLVIGSDRGVAVLDDDGRVLSTAELDDSLLRQPIVRHPSQRCVLAITADGTATMIDVESGDTLGVIDRVLSVGGTSIDGCTTSVIRTDDFALMREGVELRIDRDEVVVAVAPGGDHVVVRDRDGRAWLRDLGDDASDDTQLGTSTDALYAFVDG